MATTMDPALAAAPINRLSEMGFVYRSLFYLVTPNETSFETLEEVPNFQLKVKSQWDSKSAVVHLKKCYTKTLDCDTFLKVLIVINAIFKVSYKFKVSSHVIIILIPH